jgi:tripartite-type tricarboxylate transporter receptor subunit TctC
MGGLCMLPMRLSLLLLFVLGVCAPSSAQDWPARPIRAIVPFSAGSASDIIPRLVLEQMSAQLGQPIVIENRVGGSGAIGSAAVANAAPDGYMLLANSSAFTVTPWTVPNLPYDIIKDFVSVASFAVLPNVLVISPSKGIRTVQELAAEARSKGTLTYATAGAGSATHVSGELLRLSGKFEATAIPFKGGPEALTEVMTGRVDFYMVPILPALPLLRDGKLLPLAVSTSQRATALPDVPTTVEAGFPDSEYNYWVGLFAPAKTPPEIVARLNEAARKALQTPELKAKLAQLGADPMIMSQPDFAAYIQKETLQMRDVVKAAGLGK